MSKRKRKNWNESEARKVLAHIEREGTSIAAMARELGVMPQRIYWWRQRLRQEMAEPEPEPAFVEVSVSNAAQVPEPGFVIQVSGGRAIEVRPGFDAGELRRLLSVMETLPC